MNGASCIISDEEYLPLPNQLRPTPLTPTSEYLSPYGISDPALQLTPDKSIKPSHLNSKRTNLTPSNGAEDDLKNHHNGLNDDDIAQFKRKKETLAWVERHSGTRAVYKTGNAVQVEEGRILTGQTKVKDHRDLRRTSDPKGYEGDRLKKSSESGAGARTTLKPILHKKGDPKDANKKHKHVRLVDSPGLGQPRLNSAAALGVRLQGLEEDTFDRRKAISKNLAESKEARVMLAERAADGVNVQHRLRKHPGLISVDIPKQAILDQAVEEKLSRLKVSTEVEKQAKDPLPCPDVLDVFTPDMIVEYPNLDFGGIALPAPMLQQVPMSEVFHLYRRISGWEK